MGKTITLYECTRQEYDYNVEYTGEDAAGEPIMEESRTYNGKQTILLYHNRQQLLSFNSIPEWKAKITNQYRAEAGHTNNGRNVYDINRQPYTIL
jgi:hypothetical protein